MMVLNVKNIFSVLCFSLLFLVLLVYAIYISVGLVSWAEWRVFKGEPIPVKGRVIDVHQYRGKEGGGQRVTLITTSEKVTLRAYFDKKWVRYLHRIKPELVVRYVPVPTSSNFDVFASDGDDFSYESKTVNVGAVFIGVCLVNVFMYGLVFFVFRILIMVIKGEECVRDK